MTAIFCQKQVEGWNSRLVTATKRRVNSLTFFRLWCILPDCDARILQHDSATKRTPGWWQPPVGSYCVTRGCASLVAANEDDLRGVRMQNSRQQHRWPFRSSACGLMVFGTVNHMTRGISRKGLQSMQFTSGFSLFFPFPLTFKKTDLFWRLSRALYDNVCRILH